MKHISLTKTFRLAFLSLVFLLTYSAKSYACHGTGLLNITQTPSASGVTVNADSDPATCGCGPYRMEVEVICMNASFTGVYNYSSLLLGGTTADACALEPYDPCFIPYSDLCPGGTYIWRAREFVMGSGSGGPWSGTFTFTVPGVSPPVVASSNINPATVCVGQTVTLSANGTGGCSNNYTYSWAPTAGLSNPNSASTTALVSGPTTYTVTITDCMGITGTSTVAVAIGAPPTAGTASANPISICSGQSALVVLSGYNGNIQWQMSPNGTSWFNITGATNDSLSTGALSSSLYYQAVVSGSGCGTATSNPVQVTINPSPNAQASAANPTVCLGSSTTLNGSGGTNYTWNPGNMSGSSVSVSPTGNTTYTLVVSDANGCVDSTNVTVNVSSITASASPDVSICTGSSVTLIATGNGATGYNWQPNTALSPNNTVANPVANPASTTTYTVTVNNANGCTSVDSVTVTVTPAPPTLASSDTTLCAGGSANLTASGATQYTWNPGNQSGASISVSPSTTTTYTVQGNNGGCISYDSVTVNITPPPSVNVGPDFSICSGTNATLSANNGVGYLWAPGGQTTPNIVVSPSGQTTYTVTVTGAGGCISTDQITVSVNPNPVVTANTAQSNICQGNTTTVSASGASNYIWAPTNAVTNPAAASTTANPASTTTYTVTGADANGCSDTATVTVNVVPIPQIGGIYSAPTICGDTTGTITIGAVNGGMGPFTYTVNGVPSTPVNGMFGNYVDGTYTVTVTDAIGCTSSTSTIIGMMNTATVNGSASPMVGVYPLPVNFGASGSTGVNNYDWNFGDGSPIASGANQNHTYAASGTYTIIVTGYNDYQQCSDNDTIIVQVFEQAQIAVPNVFTPNGDGTNDLFMATTQGVKQAQYDIYDRWGVLIRTVIGDDQIGWDGKNKGGTVVPDGTYYYIATFTGYDDTQYVEKGFLTLLAAKP